MRLARIIAQRVIGTDASVVVGVVGVDVGVRADVVGAYISIGVCAGVGIGVGVGINISTGIGIGVGVVIIIIISVSIVAAAVVRKVSRCIVNHAPVNDTAATVRSSMVWSGIAAVAVNAVDVSGVSACRGVVGAVVISVGVALVGGGKKVGRVAGFYRRR